MNNFKKFGLSVLAAGALSVGADNFVSAQENILREGRVVGFGGIFCKDREAAETLMNSFRKQEAEVTVECMIGQAEIRVLKQLKQVETGTENGLVGGGRWSAVEVETADGERHYIVTTVPYMGKGMADILLEEELFEEKETEI